MTAEVRVEDVRSIAYRYLSYVSLPNGHTVTTKDGLCEAFRSYVHDLFFLVDSPFLSGA